MGEEDSERELQDRVGPGLGQVLLWLALTGVGALLYYLPGVLAGTGLLSV